MVGISLRSRNCLILILTFFILTVGGIFFRDEIFGERTFKVVEVIDGDTIKLEDGRNIRYIGLNTPEVGRGDVSDECFAQQAKEFNNQLVFGKKVKIETDVNEMDHFGRTLAYVYVRESEDSRKEIFVNEYLLREGIAKFHLDTVNQRYIDILVTASESAYEEKRGLWSFCAPDPEVGCQIKGNYDKHGHRFYHLPEFRHYSQVEINFENGDQWFCTEEEVEAAGFSRARE